MTTGTFPGMPQPMKDQLDTREAIQGALIRLHHVLLPLIEQLPAGDTTKMSLQFSYMVKGDKLIVTVVPGRASE